MVSLVGFTESTTLVEYEGRLRPKRKVVLIYPIEGDAGDWGFACDPREAIF